MVGLSKRLSAKHSKSEPSPHFRRSISLVIDCRKVIPITTRPEPLGQKEVDGDWKRWSMRAASPQVGRLGRKAPKNSMHCRITAQD